MNSNIIVEYDKKRLPRLNDKGKNPAKVWVITYYLYNPATRKYERQRRSISPTPQNEGNYDKRLREANKVMLEIKRKMREGWLFEPNEPKQPALPIEKTLQEAMQAYESEKSEQIKMQRAIRAVKRALSKCEGLPNKPLSKVDKKDCFAFRDIMQKKVSALTCNYYIRVLSCFFNYAMERGQVAQNPCKGIKPLRTKESSAHYPFTTEQRESILATALEWKESQLFLLCQFVYFTLARPYEEVQRLKIENIREHDIFFPAQNAKNGKSYSVPIAPSLEAIIQEYKLREYPANYYIFGSKGEPGAKPQGKIFYTKHRKILKHLKLTDLDDKRYTLYGHKHTGAIALAKRAKSYQDLRQIQMMCRHQALEETENYLRKIGVNLSINDTSLLV